MWKADYFSLGLILIIIIFLSWRPSKPWAGCLCSERCGLQIFQFPSLPLPSSGTSWAVSFLKNYCVWKCFLASELQYFCFLEETGIIITSFYLLFLSTLYIPGDKPIFICLINIWAWPVIFIQHTKWWTCIIITQRRWPSAMWLNLGGCTSTSLLARLNCRIEAFWKLLHVLQMLVRKGCPFCPLSKCGSSVTAIYYFFNCQSSPRLSHFSFIQVSRLRLGVRDTAALCA